MKTVRVLVQLAVIAFLAATLSGCVIIEEGKVGVKKIFGKISEQPLGAGIHLYVPFAYEIELWDVKTQRKQQQIDLPSSEGLIVQLETSVLFRPVDVVKLRREVGIDYVGRVLDPELTDTFREVIGKQRVEDLIQKPGPLTEEARAILIGKLEERGILIESLLVTDLVLPVKFKESIERKLEAQQKALQKNFELEQATKDAEIEIARAKGSAKAQEIVRRTLSPEYLQYLWISTLNKNPNVIYVATEANMPLVRTMGAPTKTKPISE